MYSRTHGINRGRIVGWFAKITAPVRRDVAAAHMCMIMYEAFRSGADPSVERAAIGRRVSETEIDLINLLETANA